jgi:hypothetical protein
MTDLPRELFRIWIHSNEEDSGSIRTYRPIGYRFPPSRGRDGFELKESGEFIEYRIGPTDRPDQRSGRWEAAGPRSMRILLQDRASLAVNIHTCTSDLLKVNMIQE